MPEQGDLLCQGWLWDAVLRELRHYARKGKGWADEPDAVERLQPVRSVTWYRWSQAPMATHTGQAMGTSFSRVVVAYEGGGDLTINESNRECAGNIAKAIAATYGLEVREEGAPGGRSPGNLPLRDTMGRLVNRQRRLEVALDESAGEILVTKSKRPFGKSQRRIRATEVRGLELGYEVTGPQERYTVWAIVGPEEERIPLASYEGYEGWADPQEWREFAQELARSLGVEARV